ncbi:MAG TPA: lysophospholipid acyltransferase family protein [Terracidiphilus sp.]|jgi:1-acyl-sn-glycerol-3-phosphate acyltransferase
MNPRLIRRAVALGFSLITSILRFWLMRLGGPRTLERRAGWVQETCVRVLRSMDVRCDVEGQIPAHGLVVANHLSYLDIVVLSAVMPCFFVAKAEVGRWPYFGKAARVGGTLFLDRSSVASAEKVSGMIRERLNLPIPVLLFPEGTSTDGTMRRFHGRLFEPAIRAEAPVTAVSIRYVTSDGTPERELCWFGDASFGPHLLETLRMPAFRAELHFGGPRVYAHRRIAAKETFAEVASMRERGQTEGLRDEGLGTRD